MRKINKKYKDKKEEIKLLFTDDVIIQKFYNNMWLLKLLDKINVEKLLGHVQLQLTEREVEFFERYPFLQYQIVRFLGVNLKKVL